MEKLTLSIFLLRNGVSFPIEVTADSTPNDITSLINGSFQSGTSQSNKVILADTFPKAQSNFDSCEHKNNASDHYDDEKYRVFFYIFDRRILHQYLSLSAQKVLNNSIIYASDESESSRNLRYLESVKTTTSSEKIGMILVESFRVYDQYFQSFERNPRCLLSYNRIVELENLSNMDMAELNSHKYFTFCNNNQTSLTHNNKRDEKNEEVGPPEEPLPDIFCDDSEAPCEEELDEFIMAPMFDSIEEAGKFFSKHPWSEWSW